MIMAGRGKRLDLTDKPTGTDASKLDPPSDKKNFAKIKEEIDQINVKDLNYAILMSIRDRFYHVCTSKDNTVDLLNYLHDEALLENEFGEKLAVIFEEMSNLEINGGLLRNELLTLIQNDFEEKDTMYISHPKKFINAVTLLGGVYNRIKVCGAPIAVLGFALLEYLEFLLKGGEEELKIVAKQILLNGRTLLAAPAFEQFQLKLREILTSNSSNFTSKCWILLVIDLISNDFKPLNGAVNEFYVSKLKEEYKELEPLLLGLNKTLSHSPQSVKSGNDTSVKPQIEPDFNNEASSKKNLTERFNDLIVKTEATDLRGKKDRSKMAGFKNPRREIRKQNTGRDPSIFGHDDRFIKEDNYYGVQMPRKEKVINKKLESDKIKKKNSVEPKCDK